MPKAINPKKNPNMSGIGPNNRRDPNKLTELERSFCLHYCGGAQGIASRAAKMAGYNGGNDAAFRRYGYEMLQRPRVIGEIQKIREARSVRLCITADEVLLDLVVVRDKARLLPGTSANLKVELAAIEKIGDHVGVMAFRKQLGLAGPTGGPIEVDYLSDLSDEELDAIELARSIIDRRAGRSSDDPESGGNTPGA